MSDAAREDAPAWHLRIHKGARRELDRLRGETDTTPLTDAIEAAARDRQPKRHAAVKKLEDGDGLLRVKVGDLRAICAFVQPALLVLLVSKRRTAYRSREVAEKRLRDWQRGDA